MTLSNENGSAVSGGKYLIGIDVGTGSARAGVFDDRGTMLASAKADITIYREPGSIVEQSSTEIWNAICQSVRSAVQISGIDAHRVAGIGFDATCSLVVLGPNGEPLPVGPSGDPDRNIIVWMDHRAVEQAQRINASKHDVLKFVGGTISPEMETPKLLWLQENKPEIFAAAWQFFDLADFLTWRATKNLTRSICTVTCKWTYLGHEKRWDESYFRSIGLGSLADEGFRRIGTEVVAPGTLLAHGLTEEAGEELGLVPGTPVSAGLIDAHAGGIGTVGAEGKPTDCLAYVFGTSSCTMTTTKDPVFVPGVWGPYYSAMVPDAWLNEGGQSAAGAAMDQLLAMHPAVQDARIKADRERIPLPVYLANLAAAKAESHSDTAFLTGDLHVVPEFLGNRAPFADPNARAVIAGLGMETDINSLIAFYIAGICAIGYGLRQIIEVQAKNGAPIELIMISGGAGQHPLVRQLLADAAGKPVVATAAEEPVLLGSAILGGVAGGLFADMQSAMRMMSRPKTTYDPAGASCKDLHARRFKAFEQLQAMAREIRNIR